MKLLAFDLETSGEREEYALQPWRVAQDKAWITTHAWAYREGNGLTVKGKPRGHKKDLCEILEFAIENDYYIVGWNITFDIAWILAYGLEQMVMKAKWLDGMRLWRHAEIEPEYDLNRQNKKSYGLKACVNEYLPQMAGYEKDVDFHNSLPERRVELLRYNEKDAIASLLLTEYWLGQLEPRQKAAALIEAESIPLIAKANLQGMLVDTVAARELRARLNFIAEEKLAKLAPYGVTEAVVRSPQQLAKLLFVDWRLPTHKEGKTGPSTDKEVLHELSFVDERAAEIRAYREALGNCTKFADNPLASAEYNGDDCTHPEAILFGTYSGRLTYASSQAGRVIGDAGRERNARLPTGFAVHQMKRDNEFRNILIPPPGYDLMEFDASGQEFRWMAIASGDKVMLKLCEPGEDPHSYMGAKIVGVTYPELLAAVRANKSWAKEARQLGKVANLSLQYRTSARTLRRVARVQYNIPMELSQAQQIRNTYLKAYTNVPNYWEVQIKQTKELRYVETFAGRRVQVKGDWDGPMGWSMGSTAVNYRIQGTGADQKLLALSVLKPYLVSSAIYFAWDLHDGLYFYVPTVKVAKAAAEIKERLDNLPYDAAWGFKPPIALPWDCKSGPSWGLLKEWGLS